ncbi:hypothetical protein [Piscinibacter sp.]|jgi:hypothetical protein|uniref:hypothetical protein n=1 Tax=Piscinibacter sp. TaxID=1903157 RepID=UPI00355A6983
MHFDEVDDGDFRIYAEAQDSKLGDGYTTSVVVKRVRGPNASCDDVFREDDIACGHGWPSGSEALSYAVTLGTRVIRRQLLMSA